VKRLLGFAAIAAVAGCTLVVGSLHECTSNGDCSSKGSGLVCQANLCVKPPSVDAGPGPGDAGFNDPNCQTLLGAVDAGLAFGYPDAGSTVFFGAILPMTVGTTGTPDARGIPRRDAIQLVVDTFNQSGGVASRYIVVRVCDDHGTATIAATEAAELAAEGAVAIITPGSGETEAAAAAANPGGAVVISGSASAYTIGTTGIIPDGGAKMAWSTAASDNLQAKVLTRLLATGAPGSGPYQHPAILWRNDNSYGNGLSAALVADVQAYDGGADAGLSLPPSYSLDFHSTDDNVGLRAQAVAALSPPPDVVVIIGTPYEADLAIGAYPQPYPAWMFSDNAESVSLLTGLDAGFGNYGLIGALGTGPATSGAGTPVYTDFAQAFTNQFGFDPATQGYLPNTYDAAMLIILGIWYGNSQGAVTGANVATLFTKVSATDAGPTALEPSLFSELTGPLTLNQPLNVRGASGDLDFDSTTGVAPGPIQEWQVDADGGIGNVGPPTIPQ
jgi:branched-chain amino acid transport system substrate-binding protein